MACSLFVKAINKIISRCRVSALLSRVSCKNDTQALVIHASTPDKAGLDLTAKGNGPVGRVGRDHIGVGIK
jgi:hypothetical protein